MMWLYDNISRDEFEKKKDYVEQIMCELGAVELNIDLPYPHSQRPVFQFNNEYYRVNGIAFENKPFIVIECGTYDELMKNIMEDADPFPYDLSDDEIKNEVKYSLEVEPYPAP